MKYTTPLQTKELHVVSFNVPYPANYGGVIDVYYKLFQLHQLGVKIHLHCFEYGREVAPQLNALCESVNYYPRKKGLLYIFHPLPYIVITRKSEALVQRLLKDHFPILLEGLHSCFLLNDERLAARFKIFRESNIEHEYYYHLYKSESKFWQKVFYRMESWKLKQYEKTVAKSQLMLVVSQNDTRYFQQQFPKNKVIYLPSFHPNTSILAQPGKGEYVLYHGNLAVAENYLAARYILTEIASKCAHRFVIAGLNPPHDLVKLAESFTNVSLITNPDDAEMEKLLRNAQVNLLLTFQATGLKLKLLNVLYGGRFCLVNSAMLAGTGLDELCVIANSPQDIISNLNDLLKKEFTAEEIELRKTSLSKNYSNKANAEKLIAEVFTS
ncbi:MAG TPA: glycosyltransferase family 1 protein [Bacteroidia bacterium]|nr:glycosyltransferase family 1 protein [Bacteroidia bacterium]HRH07376.1 glycosyltransferase family 1 protein [Bacteroidia bacterium]